MGDYKLSIVIVNYNTKDLTLNCLKSIDLSDFKDDLEVIVVDNGSSDRSYQIIRKFRPKNFTLRVIKSDKNLGFSRGNNLGAKKTSGEYLLLLNSDTQVKKDALTNLVKFADQTPDAGVVGARLLNSDGSIQGSVYKLPTLWRTVRQYWLGEKGLLDKYAPKGNLPVEVESVVGAAFLITPEARKQAGLLDEKYFMFFEDKDYCRKVRKSGLKVFYLPSASVVHLHGKSGKNIASWDNQWRRLIPSSIAYHGRVMHYLLFFIAWTSQKWSKYFKGADPGLKWKE